VKQKETKIKLETELGALKERMDFLLDKDAMGEDLSKTRGVLYDL